MSLYHTLAITLLSFLLQSTVTQSLDPQKGCLWSSLLVYFQSFLLMEQADLVTEGYGSSLEGLEKLLV